MTSTPPDEKDPYQTERWEAQLEHWKVMRALSLEAANRGVGLGLACIKASIAINGAAAASLLAFIAHLWTDDQNHTETIELVVSNMRLFIIGMITGVAAAGAGYFSEGFLSAHYDGIDPNGLEEKTTVWPWRIAVSTGWFAISLVAVSVGAFAIGAISTGDELLKLSSRPLSVETQVLENK